MNNTVQQFPNYGLIERSAGSGMGVRYFLTSTRRDADAIIETKPRDEGHCSLALFGPEGEEVHIPDCRTGSAWVLARAWMEARRVCPHGQGIMTDCVACAVAEEMVTYQTGPLEWVDSTTGDVTVLDTVQLPLTIRKPRIVRHPGAGR